MGNNKRRIFSLVQIIVGMMMISFSESDEFIFHGFNNGESRNMSFHGGAEIMENGILKLTNQTQRVIGHAFYSTPLKFKNSSGEKAFSFSTAFAFAIVPEYKKLGGHGFAFTIAANKELPGALPSQYLGLLNASDVGNFSNHIFAVEFDTVLDLELGDINDNHIGVDINSLSSSASVSASCYDTDGMNSTMRDLNLKSGKTIQAWVDYDSVKHVLNVTLSLSSQRPNLSVLSFPVDLSPILDEYMYVGFSASTGLLASSHYIFGWSFKMNGVAQSLRLSSLNTLPGVKKLRVSLTLGVSICSAAFVVLAVFVSFYIVKKIRNMDMIEPWELEVGPHRFPYKELKQATNGFRDSELIGFGGFGKVYKGTLPCTSTQVAVKMISPDSKQGLDGFISEIASIGRLRHRNLVQLLGWCRLRDDLMIVYEYMPNGSLDKYLFDGPKDVLTWEQRFKIVRGVAAGLLYLHEEWEQAVIHRDIKAGNVLLDSELNARLGDFGLAKLYEHGENPSTTRVVGTLGYLAPELTKTGKPTASSDVFAFGALLLEVVCGRRPIEPKALPEELFLVDWVWDTWKEGAVLDVVDSRLEGKYDEAEAIVVLKLGLMCSYNEPSKRPSMRQVVTYLEGEVPLPGALEAPDDDSYGSIKDCGSVISCPSSSCYEKVSAWSTHDVSGREADLETGWASLPSPSSLSGRGECM